MRRAGAGIAAVTTSASCVVDLDRAGGDDRPGDARGEALVAVLADDAAELRLGVAVDDVVGRPRGVGVHAHVERAVVAVREATLGAVELRRRHAEVEQRAAELVDGVRRHRLVEVVEPAAVGHHPVAEAVEPGAGGSERGRVAVETEESEVGARRRAAPRCGRRRPAWRRARRRRDACERGDDLVAHHRFVLEVGLLAQLVLVDPDPRRAGRRRPRRGPCRSATGRQIWRRLRAPAITTWPPESRPAWRRDSSSSVIRPCLSIASNDELTPKSRAAEPAARRARTCVEHALGVGVEVVDRGDRQESVAVAGDVAALAESSRNVDGNARRPLPSTLRSNSPTNTLLPRSFRLARSACCLVRKGGGVPCPWRQVLPPALTEVNQSPPFRPHLAHQADGRAGVPNGAWHRRRRDAARHRKRVRLRRRQPATSGRQRWRAPASTSA